MNRINGIVLLAASAALLGCTNTPDMNTQSKEEVNLPDGKSYMVPVGASHTNQAVDAKVIAFYNKVGVSNCTQGDITWESSEIADEINAILRSGSREEGIEVYKEAAPKGQIGCASPLK